MMYIIPFGKNTDIVSINLPNDYVPAVIATEALHYIGYCHETYECVCAFITKKLNDNGVFYFSEYALSREPMYYGSWLRQSFFEHDLDEFAEQYYSKNSGGTIYD